MGFVFVAFWMPVFVDLLCFGSLLFFSTLFLELVEAIFGVLGACWDQFSMFWELLRFIFRAERLCLPSWGRGHLQETNLGAFWSILVPIWVAIWEPFWCHVATVWRYFLDAKFTLI